VGKSNVCIQITLKNKIKYKNYRSSNNVTNRTHPNAAGERRATAAKVPILPCRAPLDGHPMRLLAKVALG